MSRVTVTGQEYDGRRWEPVEGADLPVRVVVHRRAPHSRADPVTHDVTVCGKVVILPAWTLLPLRHAAKIARPCRRCFPAGGTP